MTAIKIVNLTKKFKDLTAVNNVSLDIESGELFALLGVNGAGKTTLIKILSCLLAPTGGEAFINNYNVSEEGSKVKRMINVSPQETAVALNLTVRENLVFIAEIYGMNRAEANEKTDEMIRVFDLSGSVKTKAKLLSGGMQRRLSIAMALITSPQILFLDEPTLGLDVIARRELWNTIQGLKRKITIVLTTHYMEEVEALADRVAIMVKGEIRAVGGVEDIVKRAQSKTFEDAFIKICTGEVNL